MRPGAAKSSERFWLGIFLSVVVGCGYYNYFLKKSWQEMGKLKKQEMDSQKQWQDILEQYPDVKNAQQGLDEQKEKLGAIEQKNKDIEAQLLKESYLPEFLTELIKCGQGLEIDFQSVKQDVEADKTGFAKLLIDMKLESSYVDILNYVQRVEQISPFVKVEDLLISQAKENPDKRSLAALRLSALLSMDKGPGGGLTTVCSAQMVTKLAIQRNPMSPIYHKTAAKKRSLSLAGITYRGAGGSSSAIINDTVVNEGDEVDGQTVVKILSDKVMLDDGAETYSITVER